MAWKSEHNSSKTELGFTGYLPGAQATHCLFPPPAVAHQPLANKFLDQTNLRTSAWIRSQMAVLTLPEMHVINPVGPATRHHRGTEGVRPFIHDFILGFRVVLAAP